MEGFWFKEVAQGRRFVIKITPGESVQRRVVDFARAAGVRHAVVVSAVGSVQDVKFRGIKTGAKLPITEPRIHLHVMAAKSSGAVLGGHLYDARVFATCEIVLSEIVAEGLERHLSRAGGTATVFIDEE
jgi:predicted DNA-binding protein with PD1-like motif